MNVWKERHEGEKKTSFAPSSSCSPPSPLAPLHPHHHINSILLSFVLISLFLSAYKLFLYIYSILCFFLLFNYSYSSSVSFVFVHPSFFFVGLNKQKEEAKNFAQRFNTGNDLNIFAFFFKYRALKTIYMINMKIYRNKRCFKMEGPSGRYVKK